MIPPIRIAAVGVTVPIPETTAAFFAEMLELEVVPGVSGVVHLAGADADGAAPRRFITLRPGPALGVADVTFECADASALEILRANARAAGAAISPLSGDDEGGAGFSFDDLEGIVIGCRTPSRSLDRRLAPSGLRARRLGHTNLKVADAPRGARLLQDVLGLRLSEQIGEQFFFLRTGAEHHNLGLRGGAERATVHHIALEIQGWDTFKTLCDHIADRGHGVEYGPGRHSPGHNLFVYVVEPTSGLRIELFAEMDHLVDEGSHIPKRWGPGDRSKTVNRWGPQPPDSFLK